MKCHPDQRAWISHCESCRPRSGLKTIVLTSDHQLGQSGLDNMGRTHQCMTCRFNRARPIIVYTFNVDELLLTVVLFIVAECTHIIVATDRIFDIGINGR